MANPVVSRFFLMDHSGRDHGGHMAPPSMPSDGGLMSAMPGAHAARPVTMNMDNQSHSMMGMSMDMSFHFRVSETILFSFWSVHSVAGLVGSMLGIFLMAALYEGLKVLREYLQQREIEKQMAAAAPGAAANGGVPGGKSAFGRCQPWSWAHAIQTLLHMIQILFSYFLMLIFMTYNVWLCIAVVLGAGAGYFVFGWRRRISLAESFEHCH